MKRYRRKQQKVLVSNVRYHNYQQFLLDLCYQPEEPSNDYRRTNTPTGSLNSEKWKVPEARKIEVFANMLSIRSQDYARCPFSLSFFSSLSSLRSHLLTYASVVRSSHFFVRVSRLRKLRLDWTRSFRVSVGLDICPPPQSTSTVAGT